MSRIIPTVCSSEMKRLHTELESSEIENRRKIVVSPRWFRRNVKMFSLAKFHQSLDACKYHGHWIENWNYSVIVNYNCCDFYIRANIYEHTYITILFPREMTTLIWYFVLYRYDYSGKFVSNAIETSVRVESALINETPVRNLRSR